MNVLLNILKSRWFISLVGVLALSALVWFVGPLVAIAGYIPMGADWIRLLTIMVLLLVWGGSHLVRQHKTQKAEKQLASGISSADSVTDAEYDVSAVKSQVAEAIDTLKRASKGKKRNSQVLYELPWYLLIGPPGSGKTTALVNSGLDFPLEDKFGKNSVKGVGGTRHCDWWFTNDAVLIDTAGRYTTQDSHAQSDRAEWKSFIDLLKKHRKRRPINGVIVAISIQDIWQKTAPEKEVQIKAIRARLQELVDDLGVNVPIYLMFTKCDLIEGFLDTFETMSQEQRAQVWGMTLPDLQKEDTHYQQWFDTEFELLIEQLQRQQLNKFYFERDLKRRSRIINFPHHIRNIKRDLSEFVANAFSDSRFHDQFLLRGIYFTSGTQDATSINRAITQMANPLGIQAKLLSNQGNQGRSYFLKSLLHQVIFPESELVGSNRRQEKWGHWLRTTVAMGCLLILIGAGFGFSTSLGKNQLALNQIDSHSSEYNSLANMISNVSLPIELVPLMSLYERMGQVFGSESTVLGFFGLDQGNRINAALDDGYHKFTHGLFLDAIRHELEIDLETKKVDPDRLRHTLKAYLMLNDREHFDRVFLQSWFDSYWHNRYFDQPNIIHVLSERLSILLDSFSFTDISRELVEQSRRIIRQVPLQDQVFYAIKLNAEQQYTSQYRFSSALGTDYFRVFESLEHQIPRFYTYTGYNEFFKPGLNEAIEELTEDNWVVGSLVRGSQEHQKGLTDLDLAAVKSKVEKKYYDEYIAFWEKHLHSVILKAPSSLDETAQLIDALRSGRSALRGVLEEVSLNTQLTISLVTEEDIQQNLDNAQAVARSVNPRATKLARITRLASQNRFANLPATPTSMVDKRFTDIHTFVEPKGNRPAPMDTLMDTLAELQFYIENIINGGSLSESAYQAAVLRFNVNKQDVLSKLKLEARHYPEPLRRWVTQVSDAAWKQVILAAHLHIAKEYQHSLWPIYRNGLSDRFPFNMRSNREASLADFSSFFKKDGDIDLFFNEYLEPFVDTASKPWRLKSVDGYSIGINRHNLRQFEMADRIRTSFFGRASEPAVNFSIRPIYLDANVSRLELNILGDRQVYRHGPPQVKDIVWPPQSLESSISYQFEDYYQAKEGDRIEGAWSLFRFINKYPLTRSRHGNRYELSLEQNGKKAVYELIVARSNSPIGTTDIHNFKLPKSL